MTSKASLPTHKHLIDAFLLQKNCGFHAQALPKGSEQLPLLVGHLCSPPCKQLVKITPLLTKSWKITNKEVWSYKYLWYGTRSGICCSLTMYRYIWAWSGFKVALCALSSSSSIAAVKDLNMLLEVKEMGLCVRRVFSSTPVNSEMGCLTSVLKNILWMDGLSMTVYRCHWRSREGVYLIFS